MVITIITEKYMIMQSYRTVTLLFFPFALVGCYSDQGPPVEIVVPRGYQGEFLIAQTPNGKDVQLNDGKYLHVIPNDGKLFVKSISPFDQFHVQLVVFDDGTRLKS